MNGVERSNDGLIQQAIESSKCRIYKLNFDLDGKLSAHHQKKAENQKELMEITVNALERYDALERVIKRLETEGKLADEERDRCARENPLHFDTAKGYATGIYNAIEIIKEELM